MFIYSTISPSLQHQVPPFSSTFSYPGISLPKLFNFTLLPTVSYQNHPVTCSISQVYSYGTVDYERRPTKTWNAIYRRISMMDNPDLGSANALNQWETEGKKFTKWELCRVVKELRKYRRFKQALEVYEWMNSQGERFRLSASDAAIQLDLIAKVRGIPSAEDYFQRLSDTSKDMRIYGALLNAYVQARLKDKAESLFDEMRNKGYTTHSLPFNVMMTLYMNLKDYDKVELMVSKMMEKNIRLDIYSYNIWLSSRGSQGCTEKMEQVFEQMKLDNTINPNWTTFSTMATMYIKQSQFGKAEACLKKVETRITVRDRMPYHYLLSLYGGIGKKEEIYRVWELYKSSFPSIPNLGYHAVVSSLVRVDDIEGAEKIYEQWLIVKTSYDPRIGNLLIGWYVKEGILEKAEAFVDHMIEVGGKPNSSTWELLAEGHTRERRIPEALSCWKESFAADRIKSWKPKPVNVTAFVELCEQEGDTESKEVLVGLLSGKGFLEDETYASLVGLDNGAVTVNEMSTGEESDGNEMILNELHSV